MWGLKQSPADSGRQWPKTQVTLVIIVKLHLSAAVIEVLKIFMCIMMESLQARSTEILKEANIKAVEESNQREKWQAGNTPAPGLGHAIHLSSQKWGEKEWGAERRGNTKAKSFSETVAKAEVRKEIIDFLTSPNF